MRLDFTVLALTLLTSAAASVVNVPRHLERIEISPRDDHSPELAKRRGGGGGGGRGGSSSGGKSGSSSSGKSGSSSGSSSGSGSTSKTSNAGGSSSKGSGPQPSYVGGRYYGGGSTTPYRAGSRSPSGIVPLVLVGSAIAFWPGVWLYGAYTYHYPYPYTFHNDSSNKNETLDVMCGCARYAVCGCDDNNSTEYYSALVGNGSYAALNKSLVNVAVYENNNTLLINGTLPNGTTVQSDDSAAGDGLRTMLQHLGFWPVAAVVLATVFMM